MAFLERDPQAGDALGIGTQPAGADYDYAEFKAAASRAFGPVTLGAAVYWSPDFFGADEEATYVEANAAFSPAAKWTVSGAAMVTPAARKVSRCTLWNKASA